MKNGKRKRRLGRETGWFWFFIGPWIIGFCTFTAIPMLASFYYSFTDWDMFQAGSFVGLDNYKRLFQEDMFYQAVYNTFYYALFYVVLSTLLSLFVAVLLNYPLKGRRIFRTIFYIPTLVPVVVTALLFFRVFAPEGPVNAVLGFLGIEGPTWFFSETWSRSSFCCRDCRGFPGNCMKRPELTVRALGRSSVTLLYQCSLRSSFITW